MFVILFPVSLFPAAAFLLWSVIALTSVVSTS